MSKQQKSGTTQSKSRTNPPFLTTLYCSPCCGRCNCCCPIGCGIPCCYYCFPCCCCCCEPKDTELLLDLSPVKEAIPHDIDVDKVFEETAAAEVEVVTPSSAEKRRAPLLVPAATGKKKAPSATKKLLMSQQQVKVQSLGSKMDADLPPAPKSQQALGSGCYLSYSVKDNGCLETAWKSSAPSDLMGVLAYIQLSNDAIPSRKLAESPTRLVKDLKVALKSEYPKDYEAYYGKWLTFFKDSKKCKSKILLLPASQLCPPLPLVFFDINKSKMQITELQTDVFIDVSTISCIGIIPLMLKSKYLKIQKDIPSALAFIKSVGYICEL